MYRKVVKYGNKMWERVKCRKVVRYGDYMWEKLANRGVVKAARIVIETGQEDVVLDVVFGVTRGFGGRLRGGRPSGAS